MPLRIERRDDAAQAGAEFIVAVLRPRRAACCCTASPGRNGATVDRALLSLGRAVERTTRLAPSARACGCAPSCRRSTSTTGSRCCAAKRRLPRSATRPSRTSAVPISRSDSSRRSAEVQRSQGRDARSRGPLEARSCRSRGRGHRGLVGARRRRAERTRRRAARPARHPGPGRRRRGRAPTAARGRASRKPAGQWQSLARDRRRGGSLRVAAARPRAARVRRATARHRMADRPAGARQRQRPDRRRRARGASAGRAQQTKLDVSLDAKEAGAFLATIRLCRTRCRARRPRSTASSHGPARRTNSTIRRSPARSTSMSGPGRFTKIEPGPAGKLLGVLSLQALPRRVTLDFRDVFSEGFAFDADQRQCAHRERRR